MSWARGLISWVWTPPEEFTGERANVYSAVSYAIVLGLICHAGFIGLFWFLGEHQLAQLNVGSVTVFAVASLLIAKRQMVHVALSLGSLEVIAHGWIATEALGWPAGFHYHMLLMIALWFMVTEVALISRATISVIPAVAYALLRVRVDVNDAPSSLSPEVVENLAVMNLGVFAVALAGICSYYSWSAARANRALTEELSRSEALLHNILPSSLSAQFKEEGRSVAEGFEDCSVLYADLVGVAELSESHTQEELQELRSDLFRGFDALAARYEADKVRALGDSYMVTVGVANPAPDHAARLADMGLEMQASVKRLRDTHGGYFGLRLGIHSGPAVAAVVGQRRFAYDLWEDTANTAAKIRAYGLPGEVQVTETTFALLHGVFRFEFFGTPEVEGRGKMKTYLLKGRA